MLLKDRVLRGRKTIQYHIYSSIWSSIKDEFDVIMNNSAWTIGNGEEINFWNDNWCGNSLSSQFNIPAHISSLISSKVSDYIIDGQWDIPIQLSQQFPHLRSIVYQVSIPFDHCPDKLLWKHTDDGDLQLKEAYLFNSHTWQELHWAKIIWCAEIPPSKSLFVWRLMNDKVPTDENLKYRGCFVPSM
jgi:hypothetical protein